MKAEIGYKDKDTLIIDWGKEGTGFGQLTFKHKDGCKIEVDAECMDINHIIETILALKEDETYLKWESLGFLSDSTPFLGRLETAQSMEQMAYHNHKTDLDMEAVLVSTFIKNYLNNE